MSRRCPMCLNELTPSRFCLLCRVEVPGPASVAPPAVAPPGDPAMRHATLTPDEVREAVAEAAREAYDR